MRKRRLRAVTELVQSQKVNEQQSQAWILGHWLYTQQQVLAVWVEVVWRQKTGSTISWALCCGPRAGQLRGS